MVGKRTATLPLRPLRGEPCDRRAQDHMEDPLSLCAGRRVRCPSWSPTAPADCWCTEPVSRHGPSVQKENDNSDNNLRRSKTLHLGRPPPLSTDSQHGTPGDVPRRDLCTHVRSMILQPRTGARFPKTRHFSENGACVRDPIALGGAPRHKNRTMIQLSETENSNGKKLPKEIIKIMIIITWKLNTCSTPVHNVRHHLQSVTCRGHVAAIHNATRLPKA